MPLPTINELKNRRLDDMTSAERAAFDQTYDATRLALKVGEKVRDAREAAGLSQRDLAARMGTSTRVGQQQETADDGQCLTIAVGRNKALSFQPAR